MFNSDGSVTESLIEYAQKRGVARNDEQISVSRGEIEIFVKALAARALFGAEGYFKVVNFGGDPVFEKALESVSGS